ncbi:50S ribosomal protein L29 [Candidatus Purcelliella pentastirinorum]|uniref:Large ribosomal subunit protein uL29 n=1 Tax=Candidatus Purcelliella pentastirinorum TaxID=472834 RepID=A0A346DZM2_9ENTR|nr:50S ribosomal protein L29 [Candidatus Purcelliella pentastirinorum]AXN02177.1 LSU ribosomal protein L29p (L35e) [Candidatus Purcelliella pentastirinorum]WDI79128.1 50S ribosomal protein L29 [Candidatus Purcelliella pentastirinorum]WDR80267.1 50S ribosomal protein L29 [Candidatus Purcelliella pentastirinorum]
MKSPVLYNKNINKLNYELLSLYKKQFNLRMQVYSGKLNKTHLLKENRRNIARVKTIINKG